MHPLPRRRRVAPADGFTLIELLIVIVIIGILLAIAVPSYLGFKDRANRRAAQSNIRETIPSMEAYYSDASNTYVGATPAGLRTTYDSGLDNSIAISNLTATSYCIGSTVGNATWSVKGPGATAWYTASTSCTGGSTSTP